MAAVTPMGRGDGQVGATRAAELPRAHSRKSRSVLLAVVVFETLLAAGHDRVRIMQVRADQGET
jgi:hypothetical protein